MFKRGHEWETIVVPHYQISPKQPHDSGKNVALRIFTATFYSLKFKYENVKIKLKEYEADYNI
jgi:hypothetical protein